MKLTEKGLKIILFLIFAFFLHLKIKVRQFYSAGFTISYCMGEKMQQKY